MHPVRFPHFGQLCGIALVVGLVWSGNLSAQEALIKPDEIEQFSRGRITFRDRTMAGLQPATAPEVEAASRYYVLRVTTKAASEEPKVMSGIVLEFDGMINVATFPASVKLNRDNVAKFAPPLVKRFQEVFALDFLSNRLAIVNAAVMLPHAAKLKQDVIADYLASLVADEKRNDLIRMHAAKGLREYFPVRAVTRFDNDPNLLKQLLVNKKRDVERVDALLKFIDRPMPAVTDPYEIEALRYIRREAVATLAQAGVPAIYCINKGGKIEGPVAQGLIKVLAKKVQPEPSIQERLEAAIGVCQFPKIVEEYDPKIGIFLVGECFGDVLGEYKRDFVNISLKGKGAAKPTYLPWKILSKRIDAALAELVGNTRNTSYSKDTQRLQVLMAPMLTAMTAANPIEGENFRAEVQKMRPDTKILFQNRENKKMMLEVDWQPAAPAEEK